MIALLYKHKESFAHKAAKELLREWLVEQWGGVDELLGCGIPFETESGHKYSLSDARPDFVFLEYPITASFPYLIDEMDCDTSEKTTCGYRSMDEYCPCISCKFFNKKSILAVADLAVEHKGTVTYVFEIVHKSSCPDWKKDLYKKNSSLVAVLEISAQHILGQIERPGRLIVKILRCEFTW